MSTTAFLLAGLLSASAPPAKESDTPTSPPPPLPVAVQVGPGLRIVVPPLGPAVPVNKQVQRKIFDFYIDQSGW